MTDDDLIKTGVDGLLELVKSVEKISIPDAAKQLNIPQDTVQAWVDFLVEEKILGIEYKFTVPFIFFNEEVDIEKSEEESIDIGFFKRAFFERAKLKKIPDEKVEFLWKKHLLGILNRKRMFFLNECRKKNIKDAAKLFNEFKTSVMIE